MTGAVTFEVVNGVDSSRVVFIGRDDRLVTIAGATSAVPAATPTATPGA